MPNNAYLRGRKREYEIVAAERSRGRVAGRSAGSHSKVDVFAFDPGIFEKERAGRTKLRATLYQSKSVKGGTEMRVKYSYTHLVEVTFKWVEFVKKGKR